MRQKEIIVIMFVVMCSVMLWPQVVQGKLVTIQIEAVVDSVWDEGNYLEGQIKPGHIITGWYTYDTSTLDSNPSASLGRYEHYSAPCGIFLSVGGLQFETDPANVDFLVEITNDYPPNDDYFLLSYNNTGLPNGTPVDYISWHLYDPVGNALSSNALPTSPPHSG